MYTTTSPSSSSSSLTLVVTNKTTTTTTNINKNDNNNQRQNINNNNNNPPTEEEAEAEGVRLNHTTGLPLRNTTPYGRHSNDWLFGSVEVHKVLARRIRRAARVHRRS